MKLFAIGSLKKRLCPACKRMCRITITDTGDGWQRWECHECGVVTEYQITGRVN